MYLDAAIPVMRDSSGHGGSFAQYHYVVDALGMEKAKDLVPDVRRLLQTLGTDCVRGTFGGTAWVDLMERKIHQALSNGESVVIPDVRFHEEFDLIARLGGDVIGVWRGDDTSLADLVFYDIAPKGNDEHESERNVYELLLRTGFVIHNDGSIGDLDRQMCDLF